MNKKLITLAVAAAMTAPAVALADATIYGKLHQSIDYIDVDQNAFDVSFGEYVPVLDNNLQPVLDANGNPVQDLVINRTLGTRWGAPPRGNGIQEDIIILGDPNDPNSIPQAIRGKGYKGWNLNANPRSNRVGLKGSEDLGGGLKAIYQVEFGVTLANRYGDSNLVNGDRGDGISMRNSFVGLAGNWGTFLVGRHDTPLKISTGALDLFADTLADYNHTIGFHDVRSDNAIAYISPSWSGFQLAVAAIPGGGATPTGVANVDADGIADAWSAAAIYKNGPFRGSIAYENLGDEHFTTAFDSLSGLPGDATNRLWYQGRPGFGGGADSWSKWRAGLGILDWNGFTLTGIYEAHSNYLGAPKKADPTMWQIQAGYAFGNNTIKGMYGSADLENCVGGYSATCNLTAAYEGGQEAWINRRDQSSWAIAFDHNFSKRTRAYALYTSTDSDQVNADWSGFSLGMIHKF